jgi:Flp pilus assembly protein TadG
MHNHRCDACVRCRGSSTVAKGCCRVRRGPARSRLGGSAAQHTGCRPHRTNEQGQTLAEMGAIVVLCVLLSLGIVEFGYIFMALNLVMQATSAGARAASVHQMGSRGLCGKITDDSAITGASGIVRSQIGSVATVPSGGVTVTQNPTPNTATPCQTFSGSNIPLVIVTTTGTIPDVLGLFGSTISFTRTATFRDEARQ